MQLLADAVETYRVEDLARWWEWEAASQRRQQLTWSKGRHDLRKLAGMRQERSDEELAEDDLGEDVRLGIEPDRDAEHAQGDPRSGERLDAFGLGLDVSATTRRWWRTRRLTGVGLVRKATKTETGERVLVLPRFVISMLRQRDPDGEATGPVFPDTLGGWRDPSNTRRAFREARGSDGFAWVTSHVFRRTCATILDTAGQTSRAIADQLGHARVSMTQNHYLGRRIANPGAAAALDAWHDEEESGE